MRAGNILTFIISTILIRWSSSFSFSTKNEMSQGSESATTIVSRTTNSIWDVVFFVIGDHCPPGPIGKKCRDEQAARARQHQLEDEDSSSVDSNSNDAASSTQSSSVSTHYITSNKSRILAVTFACVAGSAALAAMIFGTRRVVRVRHHPLHGALNQRVTMFNKLNGSPLYDVKGDVADESGQATTPYQLA